MGVVGSARAGDRPSPSGNARPGSWQPDERAVVTVGAVGGASSAATSGAGVTTSVLAPPHQGGAFGSDQAANLQDATYAGAVSGDVPGDVRKAGTEPFLANTDSDLFSTIPFLPGSTILVELLHTIGEKRNR